MAGRVQGRLAERRRHDAVDLSARAPSERPPSRIGTPPRRLGRRRVRPAPSTASSPHALMIGIACGPADSTRSIDRANRADVSSISAPDELRGPPQNLRMADHERPHVLVNLRIAPSADDDLRPDPGRIAHGDRQNRFSRCSHFAE